CASSSHELRGCGVSGGPLPLGGIHGCVVSAEENNAREVIGLDIGSGSIKIGLVRDGVPFTIARRSLGRGVFERGQLKNAAALTSAIRAMWQRSQLAAKDVRLSIGDPSMVVRRIGLPDPGDRDAMRSLIRLNAGGHFDGL